MRPRYKLTDDELAYIAWKYDREQSVLEKLITLFPDKPWRFDVLSENPNVSLKFAFDNMHLDWYTIGLVINERNNLETIREYVAKGMPLDEHYYCRNPNCTYEEFKELNCPDQYEEFLANSRHAEIAIETNNIPFRWEYVSFNRFLSTEFMFRHINDFVLMRGLGLQAHSLFTDCDGITLDLVFGHPEIVWDWSLLSIKIPIQDILSHPELPWKYANLSMNNSVDMKIIKKLSFDWGDQIYSLPKITPEEFEKHHMPINYENMSANYNLTCEYMAANIDKPWNWEYLSFNRFIYNNFANQKSMRKDIEVRNSKIWAILDEVYPLNLDVYGVIGKYLNEYQ